MKKSILITDKVHPVLIEQLTRLGFLIEYQPNLTLEQTHDAIPLFHGILINSKIKCDKSLIEKAHKLKFIGRLGSGLDIIDQSYARKKGIQVLHTPEANCGAVAEHALAMILSLFNHLQAASNCLKNFDWQRELHRGNELNGKTFGIIGYGHTGSAFAKLLEPFGTKILCYDKYKSNYNYQSSLKEIQEKSEIISIHLPLTEETIYYVDTQFIESCSKDFFLINTARGKNVKTSCLINALDNGKILGACLDVFENENPSSYTKFEKEVYKDLMNRKNVLCTPHIAGWSHESFRRISECMAAKLSRLKTG